MHTLRADNENSCYLNVRTLICVVIMVLATGFMTGCSKDESAGAPEDTFEVPFSVYWDAEPVLTIEEETDMGPHIAVTHSAGRIHMAYYDDNPDYVAPPEDYIPDPDDPPLYPFCIRYYAFDIANMAVLNDSNTVNEIVTLLVDEGRSLAALSIAVEGTTPMIAYSVYKEFVTVDGNDLGNQGDVMIAVRDGVDNWRNEIGAFGWVERNQVFADGLAMSDMSLKGDGNGNALLSFQFYYEGADTYNADFPDLKYISQPINAFVNGSVNDVVDLEESIEGNVYVNGTGIQSHEGRACDMILDLDGNPVVFYYMDNVRTSSAGTTGLRMARRIDGEWQEHQWIETGEDVVDISAAIKSDGMLAVTYTLENASDVFLDAYDEDLERIPYGIRYAEQVEVITGQTEEGEDITEIQWNVEQPNYNSVGGRYCSLALDSEDKPVIIYFDETNLTGNRFFSRIKINRRTVGGVWEVETITPDDVGLKNMVNPYEITPGNHNYYFVGKYNYMWIDAGDRINICTYSNMAKRVFLFRQRN